MTEDIEAPMNQDPVMMPDDLCGLLSRAESLMNTFDEHAASGFIEEVKERVDSDGYHEQTFLDRHYQWQDWPNEHGPPSTQAYLSFYTDILRERIDEEFISCGVCGRPIIRRDHPNAGWIEKHLEDLSFCSIDCGIADHYGPEFGKMLRFYRSSTTSQKLEYIADMRPWAWKVAQKLYLKEGDVIIPQIITSLSRLTEKALVASNVASTLLYAVCKTHSTEDWRIASTVKPLLEQLYNYGIQAAQLPAEPYLKEIWDHYRRVLDTMTWDEPPS